MLHFEDGLEDERRGFLEAIVQDGWTEGNLAKRTYCSLMGRKTQDTGADEEGTQEKEQDCL